MLWSYQVHCLPEGDDVVRLQVATPWRQHHGGCAEFLPATLLATRQTTAHARLQGENWGGGGWAGGGFFFCGSVNISFHLYIYAVFTPYFENHRFALFLELVRLNVRRCFSCFSCTVCFSLLSLQLFQTAAFFLFCNAQVNKN